MKRKESMGSQIATVVGMACYWPFFRFRDVVGALYAEDSVAQGTDAALICFLVSLAILDGIALVFPRRAEKLVDRCWFVVGGGTVGSLAAFCALLASNGLLPKWMEVVCAFATALSFVVLTFAWARRCVASFGPSLLVMLALSAVGGFLVVPLALLPGPFDNVVAVAAPMLSGLCWAWAEGGDLPSCVRRDSGELSYGLSSNRNLACICLFALLLVVGSAVRGFIVEADVTKEAIVDPTSRYLPSLSLAIVLSVGAVVASRRGSTLFESKSSGLRNIVLLCWAALGVLFLAGLFLGFSDSSAQMGARVVIIARTFLEYFLWLALCELCADDRVSFVRVFGCFVLGISALSFALSYVVIPGLVGLEGEVVKASVDKVLLACLFALVLALMIMAGRASIAKESVRYIVVSSDERRGIRAEALRREYGLTERETEVALRFSEGVSLRVVADEMCISLHTAQSHIKRLYVKMGIHSKQELIDLFNGSVRIG